MFHYHLPTLIVFFVLFNGLNSVERFKDLGLHIIEINFVRF